MSRLTQQCLCKTGHIKTGNYDDNNNNNNNNWYEQIPKSVETKQKER